MAQDESDPDFSTASVQQTDLIQSRGSESARQASLIRKSVNFLDFRRDQPKACWI